MKKLKFNRPVVLTDRLLLINLYLTQGLTLIIGLILLFFQKRSPFSVMEFPKSDEFLYWGIGLAVIMFLADLIISRFVNEDKLDDGGINVLLFRKRPVWHIVVISMVVAICEELLFRGAIQHSIGPYWCSILFALIHVRYLNHFIPTGWVFLSSYGLGFIYIQTGSLWAPILCHFLIDCISGLVIKFRRDI